MRILYIGAGFVGACSAAVAASGGHQTLVFDIDKKRVEKLSSGDRDIIESCLFEEGLGDLLARNNERIRFTTNYADVTEFVESGEVIFMCLPTPEVGESGQSDLTYYESALKQLAPALAGRNGGRQSQYIVIVNKSTVPIGTAASTTAFLKQNGVKNFGVASNPEFLVEGKAVQGSLKPDRIVVGAGSPEDFAVLRRMYQRFVDSPSTEYIEVGPPEAEASKLLANFYLFNRLAICFDVIGRTCESFPGLKFENLRRVLTTDPRIGQWGFYDSLHAGGSCFIKDARSLVHQLEAAGSPAILVQESLQANERQLEKFLDRAQTDARVTWHGATVAVLGLAFKRDTNDVRNSPSLKIVSRLLGNAVKSIQVYDPAAHEMFKQGVGEDARIVYNASAADAVRNADVVIISTDWPQFRGIADVLLAGSKRPLIMDGRRMLQHRYADLQAAGFNIIAVGSPFLPANK